MLGTTEPDEKDCFGLVDVEDASSGHGNEERHVNDDHDDHDGNGDDHDHITIMMMFMEHVNRCGHVKLERHVNDQPPLVKANAQDSWAGPCLLNTLLT